MFNTDKTEAAELDIKISSKDAKKNYKIKKLPVYFGSSRGENTIALPEEGLLPKHGMLEIKKGQLYYQDLGKSSKVNDILIEQKKIKLRPGNNEIAMGRTVISFENEYVNNTFDLSRYKGIAIKTATALAAAAVIIFLSLKLFSSKEIEIKSYTLTPEPLSIYQPVVLSDIRFNKDINLNVEKTKYFVIINKDTIYLKYRNKVGFTFVLPNGLVWDEDVEKNINMTLKIVSEEYNIKNDITSTKTISNRDRLYIDPNGVKFHVSFNGRVFDYKISASDNNIKKASVDFGDNRPKSTELSGQGAYFEAKTYTMKVDVILQNNRTVHFESKIPVKND